MRRLWLYLLLLAALGTTAHPSYASADKYYIPPQQFNAAFQVMDMGFANVFGFFQSSTGQFAYDKETSTISHVRFALDASSLMTANPEIRRDLATLFETRRYPEISFMATSDAPFKDGKAEIKGTIAIHGVQKPFTFEATLNQSGNSPKGGGMWAKEGPALGLSLRGSFKRADFGMGDPPEMPGRFGDSLSLMLEMQAIRQ